MLLSVYADEFRNEFDLVLVPVPALLVHLHPQKASVHYPAFEWKSTIVVSYTRGEQATGTISGKYSFRQLVKRRALQYLAYMKIFIQLRKCLWCMYFWLGMSRFLMHIWCEWRLLLIYVHTEMYVCVCVCRIFKGWREYVRVCVNGRERERGWTEIGSTCNGMHLLLRLGKLLNWYYVSEWTYSWPAKRIITEYYI